MVLSAPVLSAKMELFNSLKIAVDGPVSETLGALTSLSLDTSLTLYVRSSSSKPSLSISPVMVMFWSGLQEGFKEEATGGKVS